MCRLGGKGRRVGAIGMKGDYGTRRGCADATDGGAGAALGARVAVLVEKDYQA